jgi:hypothetical protein
MGRDQYVFAGERVETAMRAIEVREHERTMAQAIPNPQDEPYFRFEKN